MNGFSKLFVNILQEMMFSLDNAEFELPKWWAPNTIAIRLSTTVCLADGSGWNEVNKAGYSPVNPSSLFDVASFSSPYIGTTGLFLSSGYVFFHAAEYWGEVKQVGFWLSKTNMDHTTFFLGGVELSPYRMMYVGDTMVFEGGVNEDSSLSFNLATY